MAVAAQTEGRFEAAHGGVALTPLVGREEEVALLLRRWHRLATVKDRWCWSAGSQASASRG